jgi:hypothetical protein
MDLGLSALLAGIVSAGGGIIVALIQRARRENSEDHRVVQQQLSHVFRAVGRVEDLMHGHLQWHRKETDDGTRHSAESSGGPIEAQDRA